MFEVAWYNRYTCIILLGQGVLGNKNGKAIIKYKWIIIAAICVAVCFGVFGWFGRPGGGDVPAKGTKLDGDGGRSGNTDRPVAGSFVPNELVGLFENEDEAKRCAELYGIELKSFNYGVAVFKAEGNLKDIIAEGERNGWPALSLNHRYQAFEKE